MKRLMGMSMMFVFITMATETFAAEATHSNATADYTGRCLAMKVQNDGMTCAYKYYIPPHQRHPNPFRRR